MRDKHTDQVVLDILKPVNHVTLTPAVISFSWPSEHLGIDQLLDLFSTGVRGRSEGRRPPFPTVSRAVYLCK